MLHTHTHTQAHAHTYTRTHVHTQTRPHTHTPTHTHTHPPTHTHTHTHAHTCTHPHTHTPTQAGGQDTWDSNRIRISVAAGVGKEERGGVGLPRVRVSVSRPTN